MQLLINCMYNNLSLNEKNSLICNLNNTFDAEVNDMANEIKQMETKQREMAVSRELRSKQGAGLGLPGSVQEHKISALLKEQKRIAKKNKEQQKKAIAEERAIQQKIDKLLKKQKKQQKQKKGKEVNKQQFGCYALFYQIVNEEDELGRKQKTIQHEGVKYRQVFAGYTNVRGNILPFNNKRTFRVDDLDRFEILLKIMRTDDDVREVLKKMEAYDIDLIIIKDAVEQDKPKKKWKPLRRRLFSEATLNAICRKHVSYKLNRDAETFGEMFDPQFDDYIKDNFKANSCFPTAIVDHFGNGFEKRKSDGKRMFAPLTYETVCEIIGLKCKSQDIGLTIRGSVPFFEKFRLGLDVVNEFGVMLFTYRPPAPVKLNPNIRPQILRISIHNSHCIVLDLSSKVWLDKLRVQFLNKKVQLSEVGKLHVSNKYFLRQPVLDSCSLHFIEKLDDCMPIVKSFDGCNSTKFRFITNTDLLEILYEMLGAKKAYMPKPFFGGGRFLSLQFTVGKVTGLIETTNNTAPDDSMYRLNSKEEYVNYHKANDIFYNKILSARLKSEYPESVLDIEEKYQMGPLSGYFTNTFPEDVQFNAFDFKKAYTSCMRSMEKVSVFGYFDIYKPYDNHEVEDDTMYLVEVFAKTDDEVILFPTVESRCYGDVIKKARTKNISVTILSFRRAWKIEQVNYKQPIDELYANEKLSEGDQKDIVNKTAGLAEKWYNKANVCKIFDTFAEAQHYQLKYGGKIISLQRSTQEKTEVEIVADTYEKEGSLVTSSLSDEEKEKIYISKEEYENLDYDDFSKKYPNKLVCAPFKPPSTIYGPKVHILIIEKKERLVNGFRPIKERIYNTMAIKMFDLYHLIVSKGIVPKGIKTDAILVSESKEELEKLCIFDTSQIGGLRFESGKYCTDFKIKQRRNEVPNIQEIKVDDVKIKDEYDTQEFKEIFDEMTGDNNRLLIEGEMPGVGKTTCVTNYKGHKILFATPGNKLAQKLRIEKGVNATTAHKVLGVYGNGQEYVKMKRVDISPYDCICFDEIMMHSPQMLHKIHLFMRQHPTKKFFLTGDIDQLQPIDCDVDFEANNISDKQAYLKSCVYQMIPNRIILKINKRLKTEEQRESLSQLKQDIFDKTKNIMDTLKAHGFKVIRKFSDIESKQNICYFNYRAKNVNSYVHRTLITPPKKCVRIDGIAYWPDLELVYKGKDEEYKASNVRLFKNYNYSIKSINKNNFTIRDVEDDETFTFPVSKLAQFFLPYANTCHSIQGLSIDGPLTIFDLNTPHIDRFFVWTAITRSTDFSQVTIFEQSTSELVSLERSRIKRYMQEKVDGYKRQDKIAFREFKPCDFVTVDWIREAYDKLESETCGTCKEPYVTRIVNGTVESNLTVDRIDNNLAHTKQNSRLCCKECNVARSNHY